MQVFFVDAAATPHLIEQDSNLFDMLVVILIPTARFLQFKKDMLRWFAQYHLQTFKTQTDISPYDKSYTSYPTMHYVKPCLLIEGQLRAVAGDKKPCGIWCEFSKYLAKPPTGQASLSVRYGQTDLRAACHLISLHRDARTQTCTNIDFSV